MVGKRRTVVLGLDACDPEIAMRLAATGEMPNLARLVASGATARFENERGYFVGAVWPTLMTGVPVDRHYWYSGTVFRPHDYTYEPTRDVGTTLWDRCSEVGLRVAVFDAPHAPLVPELNGVQVVEWGAHDHLHRTDSSPPELLAELNERYGEHPIGTKQLCDDPRHSPCDYVHKAGAQRSLDEQAALFADLRAGVDRKLRASLDVFGREDWDLFFSVFGESHCAGHQLWCLHDPTSDRFDADALRRLGTDDPVVEIYRRLDNAVGAHLERLTPDDTVYLLLSHGMAARNDANHLLPQVLHRLEAAYERETAARRGPRIGRADALLHLVPDASRASVVRRLGRVLRRPLAAHDANEHVTLPTLADRLFFPVDNHSVVGAVRLNVVGREGNGRVVAGDVERVTRWLTRRLRELINVETGRPIVDGLARSADIYANDERGVLPDLLIEWAHGPVVRRVWSPATGVFDLGYDGVRSGDHHPRGLLVAAGPGVTKQRVTISPLDLVPTVAASTGVPTPDLDGRAVAQLVPQHRRAPSHAGERALIDEYARAGRAMGATEADDLAAEIVRTTRYVESVDVGEDATVTVVIATRDRAALLGRAIDSVLAQTYKRFEVVVVDNGSDRETWNEIRAYARPRVRCVRLDEPATVGAARNAALDGASGDIVVYLDDDNTFAPHWLKAVVWAFGIHPEARMLYGARTIDDVGRHFGRAASGDAGLQLLRWDRRLQLAGNLIDMNVLAHRAGGARFDPELSMLGDWELVLQLTASRDPLRLPVVAAHYTTDAANRLSDRHPDVWRREQALIFEKWRPAVVE